MLGSEGNPHPIQLVVNYWERRPRIMRARLDELLHHGITHIASFVPWQALESDISHTLVRFLQAAADKKMTVSLIVTPEVGVHYPNSGFPKDVIAKRENLAAHSDHGPIVANMAPNAFAMPSLFAPELNKRYYSFLTRVDTLLADIGRTQPELLRGVKLVTTGGIWKYYRSPKSSVNGAFNGIAGEFSNSANLSFRRRVEEFFGSDEFATPNLAAANRWKTRNLEETNRRWFFQQSEDSFRSRSFQYLRRKSAYISADEIEMYTPEADPSVFYSSVLQMLSGGNADFEALAGLIDEYGARGSMATQSRANPAIHWSSLGGFRRLSDSEKQFLIVKSLLVMGGQSGSIFLDSADWFQLSANFRARTESLARSLSSGDLRIRTRALYLSPHLWSGASALWDDLHEKVGLSARLVASIDLVLREKNAEVLVVDPSFIFTKENILKLLSWTRAGRTLVLPRSALYTEAARTELESVLAATQKMDMALGVSYRLHRLGDGHLFVCDYTEQKMGSGATSNVWSAFMDAVLSVANVHGYCRVSDARLSAVPLERRGGGLGLFVLNGTREKVSGDIIFQDSVKVSDLSVALSARSEDVTGTSLSPRFSLEVPACGIFPLAVDGQQFADLEERFLAAEMDEVTAHSILRAGGSELPGIEESTWN
jgi:hypothetical protein